MIVSVLTPELARTFAGCLPADLAKSIEFVPSERTEWWAAVPAGALIVLDPALLDGDSVSLAAIGAVLTTAGARVVFYTSFSAESMRAVAFAAVLHPVELWITGVDDRAGEFARRVQRLTAHGLVDEVLTRLLSTGESLRTSVRAALIALFAAPERFFDADDVARVAMTSRRNLDRYFVECGLGTARRLIVAAKIIHGVTRLGGRDGRVRSVRNVSESLGYSDPEVFARHFADVFGVRPSARGEIDDSRLVASLIAYSRSAHATFPEPAAAESTSMKELAVR